MNRDIGRWLAGASLVLVLAWAGCGDVIEVTEFDQTCSVDDDCVPVIVGEMCDCLCTMAAINKADLPRYEEVATDRACSTLCTPCEEPATAVCDAEKCALR